MVIYIDESGDLGWKFDAPYRHGGSSRYISIAYAIVPSNISNLIRRPVIKTYKKFNLDPQNEHKGSELNSSKKKFFLNQVNNLILSNKDIQLGIITVKKERVYEHIRRDGNKLYNYMLRLSILEKIKKHVGKVTLVRDERTIKVANGKSLIDYLQTELWFEENSKAQLIDNPKESHTTIKLIFVDWLCNCLWSYYEDGCSDYIDIVRPNIHIQTLFF